MKNNFNQSFKYLLQDEGGYTNDKSDSGGATNLGITIGDYRKYIKKDATPADVKTLTVAQAQGIYKSKYWDALSCDDLPSGVDNTAFNYGVLAGIGRPRADLVKFKGITDPDKLIDAICDEMKAFLIDLAARRPKDQKFKKGWVARVDRLRTRSHAMAKTPSVAGPAGGATATLGVWATLSQFVHDHPYWIAGGSIAAGVLVWALVHYMRNRNVKPNQSPVPVASELPHQPDTSVVG